MCYLTIPEGEKRSEEEVQVEIGKEIKLKHKAPVVSMFVVDKDGMPLLGNVMEDKDKGNFQCVVHSGGYRMSSWPIFKLASGLHSLEFHH